MVGKEGGRVDGAESRQNSGHCDDLDNPGRSHGDEPQHRDRPEPARKRPRAAALKQKQRYEDGD